MLTSFGVNAVLVTIVIYTLLLIVLLGCLIRNSIKFGCKFKRAAIVVFLFGIIDFIAYLIREYYIILRYGVNPKLNYSEIIFITFSTIIIILSICEDRCCGGDSNCNSCRRGSLNSNKIS